MLLKNLCIDHPNRITFMKNHTQQGQLQHSEDRLENQIQLLKTSIHET